MKWYSIKNQTAETADVELYDEIGAWGISAKEFIKDLRGLDGKHINLHINSPGGSIVDGNAIITALKRHKGGFSAWVDGLAASMASVIACAADKCFMSDSAMLMIHRASMVSMGDADELRKDADLLEKFEKSLVNIYEAKTGMGREEIQKMLDEETWLDALEAVALGFADGLFPAPDATAKLSGSDYKARYKAATVDNKTPIMEANTEIATQEVVEEVIEATPEVVETPAESEEAVAKIDTATLVAQVEAIRKERDAIAAELSDIKAKLSLRDAEIANLEEDKRRLAVAAGVAPAAVEVAVVPAPEVQVSILDKFAAIKNATEKNEFYRKHRKELLKAGFKS